LPARIGPAADLDAPPPPPGTWREVFADRRLLLFLASIFPMTFIFMQATSSFALYTADCGLSSGEYGLLLSCNGVLIVVGELSLTGITRRFRPAPVLMLGYLMLGVGFACGGLVRSFWPLAATVVLWTLGEMVSAPTQGAVLANMAPDHLRGRYMAASGFLWSAATIVGPWLGTTLYAWHPPALWWTAAGAGLASAAAIRYSLRPRRPVPVAPDATNSAGHLAAREP
jgi:MFS family permease